MEPDPGDDRAQTAAVFARLAEVLYADEDYQHAYQAVCSTSRLLVANCDHASLLMRQGDQWTTVAATDDTALTIDRLERQVGTGPCVDAIVDDTPQFAPDLVDPGAPWPELRALILSRTPVRGMLGFRILHQGRKHAALNLFSDQPSGFTHAAVDQAAVLAAFSTVALQAAAEHRQAVTLREGLASNREIGKAIGLLMAYHKISDQQAFGILRDTSSQLNLKISAVATQILAGHHNQLLAPGEPRPPMHLSRPRHSAE